MQNTNNRSFLFLGNLPVYNTNDGLTDGQTTPDFIINGRIIYEFDNAQLRFQSFSGNPFLCEISGRPLAVEMNMGGLSALIALIENRATAPQGLFLPLANTAYNQNGLRFQTIGYVSVNGDTVTFFASNGSDQKQFAVSGKFQLTVLLNYLKTMEKLVIETVALREGNKNSNNRTSGYNTAPTVAPSTVPTPTATPAPSTAPTATPAPSAAPTATPAPSAAPTATPAPSTAPTATPAPSAAPAAAPAPSAAPTIDMPEINI